MNSQHNFFLKTDDGENIFYSTNFKPGEHKDEVLVFNYGLVCSNFHWKWQISYFEEMGYSIVTHDYRGHYQSSGGENLEGITFNRIAKDLDLILTKLGITNSIQLGHSMGVNVSLEYAKLFPEKVESMILISGTILPVHNVLLDTHLSGPLTPILKDLLTKFPKPFRNFWKYGGWTKPVKAIIRSGGFNTKQVDMDFIETYLNKLGELGPELFFHLIDQMQSHDCLAFAGQIKTKTLVIGGNRDKVIPNFSQRLMAKNLKNSELYLIHTGSHVPQVDFPQLINERIHYYLTNDFQSTLANL